MADQLVQGQFHFPALFRERDFDSLRFQRDALYFLRQPEDEFHLVKRIELLDDLNRAGRPDMIGKPFSFHAAEDRIGIQRMGHIAFFIFLFHQGNAALGWQAGFNDQIVPQQSMDGFQQEIFHDHVAVKRIQPEYRMREIKDLIGQHSGLIARGLRLERSMLMRTEMQIGPVEIGVVDPSQAPAAGELDFLRWMVHHKRGGDRIGKLRRDPDEIREQFRGPVMFQRQIERRFVFFLFQQSFSGQDQFAAAPQELFEPFAQRGIRTQRFRQDQHLIFGKVAGIVQAVERDMSFQQQAGDSRFTGFIRIELFQETTVRKDRDVGRAGCAAAPGFFGFDFGISGPDQPAGAFVQHAAGVQLVADAAPRPLGEHRGAFITQGIRMLESAEFAPGGMEFSGHAEKIIIFQGPAVCRQQREMVIAPAARRQRFQFQMAEKRQQIAVARSQQIAVVVEHRQIRIHTPCRRGAFFQIFDQCPAGETQPVLFFFRIVPFRRHIPHTPRTAALPL